MEDRAAPRCIRSPELVRKCDFGHCVGRLSLTCGLQQLSVYLFPERPMSSTGSQLHPPRGGAIPARASPMRVSRLPQWSWCETLGAASADARSLLVGRIRMGMVQDRCWEMGLRQGQEIRCRRRSREGVTVELPGGEVGALEFPYAWFVEVTPIESAPEVSKVVALSMGQ